MKCSVCGKDAGFLYMEACFSCNASVDKLQDMGIAIPVSEDIK